MRRPDGAGCISRLPGNRRKPYRVRVTTGFETDENGRTRQIQRTVGTFATYQEAEAALAEYNRNPVNLDPNITFAEIYRLWSAEKFQTISDATRQSYRAAFRAVPMLHDEIFAKLRRNHLQNAIDTSGKNLPTLENIRLVISMMYRYALQNDIVQKDYSRFIDLTRYRREDIEDDEEIHTDIKPAEIAVLWKRQGEGVVVDVLMLIYSGLRVGEYLSLTAEDIDTEGRFLNVRKSKTAAGRRRVPIAQKTLPMWEQLKHRRAENPPKFSKPVYNNFKRAMIRTMKDLGLPDHLPHDTRHTTATLLHAAKIDPYIVKRILGHSTSDVTEGVYTHIPDADLLAAIDKL